jgi:hypothetical protein
MIDGVDVFVSYQAADRAWAEWIAHVLEDAGLRVKVQAWDVPAGANFVNWMATQLAEAKQTVAVYSADYFASRWCTEEWTAALLRQNLVPVRVAPVEPPSLLATRAYTDLFGVPEEIARERLLNATGMRPIRRAAVGGFPGGDHIRAKPVARTRPTRPDRAELTLSTVYPFLRSPTSASLALQVSADGKHFGAVDNDRRMWLFDLDRPTMLARVRTDPAFFAAGDPFVAFPSAELCVTGCRRTLRFFAVPSGELRHEIILAASITGVAAARNAGWIAVATAGNSAPGLVVCSMASYEPIPSPAFESATGWAAEADGLSAVGVAGDGSSLFTAAGRSLMRWHRATGRQDRWEAADVVTRIAVSETGERFATGGKSKTSLGVYELWNADKSESLGRIHHTAYYPSIDIDPSGSVVAVNRDRAVHLLRQHDQTVLATLPDVGAHVAFTADGRNLITVDNPGLGPPTIRRRAIRYPTG